MKAIVYDRYGPPDVLRLEDVPKPTPEGDEVLIKVQAASVNAGDWHLMRADPFLIRLMYGGIMRPKHRILGADVAGRIESVGPDASRFKPGDEVFGDLSESGFGAFAEFVAAPEAVLAEKPSLASFVEAAAVPLAGLAALQGLRDKGRIRKGKKVLINGASGGVGTCAVQIAKSFGTEITGVCSAKNADMVRSIGADHVVDYKQSNITQSGEKYDLILDAAAYRSPSDYASILAPDGMYVMVGGSTGRLIQMTVLGPWLSTRGDQRFEVLMSKPNRDDLQTLKDLLHERKLKPVISKQFSLAEVPEAIRALEEGRTHGKVVINID